MKTEQKSTESVNSEDPGPILNRIHGKKILDVATGTGANIQHLISSLGGFSEIIGIDIEKPERIKELDREGIFNGQNVRYMKMDAADLKFDDSSFDIVSVGNSLHHLDDPVKVLNQMFRVLKKGGHSIISEMYRDEISPESQTHVLVHHWWAEIDNALGVSHRETYRRCELVEMIEGVDFKDNMYFDIVDDESDPFDEERKKYFSDAIEKYLQRAGSLENFTLLKDQSKNLINRIDEVGIRWAPVLLAVCRK